MIPFARQCGASLPLALAWLLCCTAAAGQDEPPESETDRLMRKLASRIELFAVGENDARERVELIPEPLMRIYDPARAPGTNVEQDGMLYAFGRTGRPAAFVEVWRWKARPNHYGHTMISTAAGRLLAQVGGREWRPRRPGLEFSPMDQAPAPSSVADERDRQMAEVAQQFTAYEIFRDARIDLELMLHPVRTYQAEKLDGAVFIFAHHHNPEAILFLESAEEKAGKRTWRYAAAPCTSQELHIQRRGADVAVFPQPENHTGAPTDPFWVTFVEAGEE